MTQISEYHENDKYNQLSGYDGSGSVQKNPSSDHINIAFRNSLESNNNVTENMLKGLGGLFD